MTWLRAGVAVCIESVGPASSRDPDNPIRGPPRTGVPKANASINARPKATVAIEAIVVLVDELDLDAKVE